MIAEAAYGLCVLFLLALAALALRQDRKGALHRDFAAFAVLMALWLASLYLYYRAGSEAALTLIGRANFAFVALALCYGHLFARGLVRRKPPRRAWLGIAIGLVTLTLLTPLVAAREVLTASGPATRFGPLFPLLALHLAFHVAAAGIALARSLRTASAERRAQVQLVLVGFLATAAVALSTNLLLPAAFGIFRYQEAGALSSVFLVASLGYAVVARGLLDVRVVVGRTVVFAALVGALSALYGALALLAGQALSGAPVPREALLFNLGSVVAVGLTSEPLRRWIAARTDRWLFQRDRETQAAAARLSERLAWTADLADGLELVLGSVRATLRPVRAAVLALGSEVEGVRPKAAARFGFGTGQEALADRAAEVAEGMSRRPSVVDASELDPASAHDAALLAAMEALGVETAVPLRSGNRLRGLVLLGRKKSGARLSLSDLAYLELVRSAAVSALQKSELADEGRAKTEMVSVAAHELLTPIAGVQGYLSMVLDEGLGEVDERARGYLSKANASARRLSSLVKDLLSASRVEAGKTKIELRPTDVAAIARDAVDGVLPMAREKGLRVTFTPSSGLPLAMADPDRLAEVLTNLVGNAVKYTPKGSVEVAARSEGACVRIDVRDTGLGMSEEARARLFQKFYRVKTDATRDIPGTGLGLYVTRQLVERMGGRIEVVSKENTGSTFTVRLPNVE